MFVAALPSKTNALTDKQLVDNVVKRADQHGNNTLEQQNWRSNCSDGFCPPSGE